MPDATTLLEADHDDVGDDVHDQVDEAPDSHTPADATDPGAGALPPGTGRGPG